MLQTLFLIFTGETNNKFDMHIASKEHAIDSSITTPLSSIEEEQLARRGHQREIPPPRSNVHMLPKSQSQYDQSGTGGTSNFQNIISSFLSVARMT